MLHSGTMIDANVLADAWSSYDEEGPAGINVEALAAAWDDGTLKAVCPLNKPTQVILPHNLGKG